MGGSMREMDSSLSPFLTIITAGLYWLAITGFQDASNVVGRISSHTHPT